MFDGTATNQMVLSILIEAKEFGIGDDPSYLNAMAPEPFSIPIYVVE